MKFDYDAFGQRIAKHIHKASDNSRISSTYYVRDAQGNIMATYEQKLVSNNVSFLLMERPIYGSSRIAIDADQKEMMQIGFGQGQTPIYINRKYYELSNHLGNVISVVSDVKYPVGILGGNIQSFKANIVSYNDYMPGGSIMPGRNFSSEKYRFGFNTQEKTDEINGLGNHTTAEFWEYDPRLGFRWNTDPKPTANESPYSTNKDNPVLYNDPFGDCPPGVDCGGKASLTYTFGTKNQSRINFAVGLGASKTSGNLMSGANLSLNLYSGGPGTSQASTGQSSFGGALTLGLSGTLGSGAGSGTSTDLNMFNSTTLSGINNTFESSGTVGTNLTFNSTTGFNRASGFAAKLGGFTATLNEDFSVFKNGGLLASGKDEGETGGGFLGYTSKSGTSIFVGTEIFTGKPLGYPKPSKDGYVLQKPDQQLLNVGRSFLKIESSQGINNIRLDYSGQSQMWLQNFIHDRTNKARFNSTAENSLQITH